MFSQGDFIKPLKKILSVLSLLSQSLENDGKLLIPFIMQNLTKIL